MITKSIWSHIVKNANGQMKLQSVLRANKPAVLKSPRYSREQAYFLISNHETTQAFSHGEKIIKFTSCKKALVLSVYVSIYV